MPKEKSPSPKSEEKAVRKGMNWLLVIPSILVILVLLGVSIYFYLQYQNTQNLLKNPSSASQSEINALVAKVGKHYDLPQNDQVTVATVSDMTKLQGQTFFAKAHNGDKVLIYPKTGVAILYRPSTDKIINVGPVNTQADTSTAPTTTASQPVKVALYNGTQTTGLTKKVQDSLASFTTVKTTVVTKSNATNNYPDSVVVDLTGKNAQAAKDLATFAKGKVASLPAGEAKPDGADILIILGQSYVGTVTPTTPTPCVTK